MNEIKCTICENAVDKNHDTKEHLEVDLKNTIEAYERHCYNHGGLGDEAKNLFAEIDRLEKLLGIGVKN